jgi:hypothetical protein
MSASKTTKTFKMPQLSGGSKKMNVSLFMLIVSCGLIVWLLLTRPRPTL